MKHQFIQLDRRNDLVLNDWNFCFLPCFVLFCFLTYFIQQQHTSSISNKNNTNTQFVKQHELFAIQNKNQSSSDRYILFDSLYSSFSFTCFYLAMQIDIVCTLDQALLASCGFVRSSSTSSTTISNLIVTSARSSYIFIFKVHYISLLAVRMCACL